MTITIDLRNESAEVLQGLRARLADSASIHAAMAGAAEVFVKDFGARNNEHRTANRLGARPTGHLLKAYQDIEAQSDASSATLLVPRATRLRAAFGGYTVQPTGGRQYLTIPVSAESYGKRAREFDLKFSRVPRPGTPSLPPGSRVLMKKTEGKFDPADVMFRLIKRANIPADEGLMPFDDIQSKSADAAELYILTGEQP